MPSTSPLETAANIAAAKVRSRITRTSHERYPWLFISPASKEDVRPVVECWLQDKTNLENVTNETGIVFNDNPWDNIADYYPILWTRRTGLLQNPFPNRFLVIIGLEYVDQNNGLPKISKAAIYPGEYTVLSGEKGLQLSEGGGGISLFVLLNAS